MIDGLDVEDRVTGVAIAASTNITLAGAFVSGDTTGVNVSGASSGIDLLQNWFQGNTPAVNNASSPFVQVLAQHNYWNAASGPSNLGGSGNGYSTHSGPASDLNASPFLTVPPESISPSVFAVTTAYDVLNIAGTTTIPALLASPPAGGISLRDAITAANNTAGAQTIDFDIDALGGNQTIVLSSALPTITNQVTIDGSTQPGGTITINGSAVGGNALDLQSGASGSIIEGFALDTPGTAVNLESSANNVTLQDLDLSWTGPSQSGTGISANTDTGLTIGNMTIENRGTAVWAYQIENLQVTGSNLSNNNDAMDLYDLTGDGSLHNGGPLWVTGLTANNTNRVLDLENMSSAVTISNADATGVNIVLPNAALESCTGNDGSVITANNDSGGVSIENLNMAYSGSGQSGTGISANTDTGLTIGNMTIENRGTAVWAYQIENLQVTGSNLSNNNDAMDLYDLTGDGSLHNGGPLWVTGLTANNTNRVLDLENMSSAVTISNADATGVNIVLPNAALESCTGNDGSVITANNDSGGVSIENLNMAYSGSGQSGTGISANTDTGLTIGNMTIENRGTAVWAYQIENLQVTGSNLSNNNDAMDLYDLTGDGSLHNGGPLWVTGLTANNTNRVLDLENMSSAVTISNADATGVNIVLPNAALESCTGNDGSVITANNDSGGVSIENLNMAYSGSGQSGTGISANTDTGLTIGNMTIENRGTGLWFYNGALAITGSTFSNNGTGLELNTVSQDVSLDQNITESTISGNGSGIQNGGGPQIQAENNWWGAATGPNTAGADTYTGSVNATPFLTAPVGGLFNHRRLDLGLQQRLEFGRQLDRFGGQRRAGPGCHQRRPGHFHRDRRSQCRYRQLQPQHRRPQLRLHRAALYRGEQRQRPA